MGKYTAYPAKYDKQLELEFDKIVKAIRKEIEPVSIILFGGFGKGEGSAEIKKGKIVALNDFDFYVITKEKVPAEFSDLLTEKASVAIGAGGLDYVEHPDEKYDPKKFFHADIRCISIGELPKLRRTQRTFELKYSSQVIWGDKNVLDRIKGIGEGDLPVPEGIRPMFNKFDTLLLCMDERKLSGKMDPDDKRLMIFYSMKAYLTCAEALLILSGNFKPTYTKRAAELKRVLPKRFPALVKKVPGLMKNVELATSFKLKPKFDIDDPVKLWFEARDCLGTVFRYVLSEYLSLESDDWKTVADSFSSSMPYRYFEPYLREMLGNLHLPGFLAKLLLPSQYLLNIKYFRKLRERGISSFKPLLSWKDIGLKLPVPLFLLLFSIRKDGTFDREMVELSKRYLGKIKRVPTGISLEELRMDILYMYGLYYLQKLI